MGVCQEDLQPATTSFVPPAPDTQVDNKLQSGTLRVVHVKNPPHEIRYYPADSIIHAAIIIDMLSRQVKESGSLEAAAHYFDVEVYEDGKWIQWKDEDGTTIDELDLDDLWD